VVGDGGPREDARAGASGSMDGGSWSSSQWLSRVGSQNGGGGIEGVPAVATCEGNELL
jgi:hypothetical protein